MYPCSAKDLTDLARKAGARIMEHRGNITSETKSDGTPVTLADKDASDIIVFGLKDLTPDIPVICEELSPDQNRRALESDTVWVVDPLDGTRTFMRGHDGFGVHIALVRNGEPVMGAVYFPSENNDKLYFTGDDGAAYRQSGSDEPEKITVSKDYASRHLRAAVHPRSERRPPDIRGHFYEAVTAVGGGRTCLVADGQADLAWMVRKKTKWSYSWWDVAAAHAVLKAAGGEMLDLETKKPFRYNAGHFGVPDVIAGQGPVWRKLEMDPGPS